MDSTAVLGQIGWTVAGSAVLAAVVAIGAELLDRLVLQDTPLLRSFLPDGIANRIGRRFSIGPQPGTAMTLLSTIAQIAGIFLGLYFAAVSAIASAVYSDVPGEVRLLLTREKVGNVYIRTVALLGALSVGLAAAMAVRVSIGILNLAVVGGLAAISVLAFVVLGLRAFNFFSPDALAGYLIRDLGPLVRGSARGAFASGHQAIPFNYQRQAEELLATFRGVVTLSASRTSVTERSLAAMSRRLLSLLSMYTGTKSDIPTESYWFKRRLEHPKWLTAGHTEVELAVRSQTALQPKETPDRMWFERELEAMLRVICQALLERPERLRVVEVLDALQNKVQQMGRQLAIDEALSLRRVLTTVVEEHLAGQPSHERETVALALADIHVASLMSLVLGISERLRPLGARSFTEDAAAVDRLKPTRQPWPLQVAKQREFVADRLAIERQLESHRVSARWYSDHLIALGLVQFMGAAVPQLLDELDALTQTIETWLDRKQVLLCSQGVQRGLEVCEKYRVHFDEFTSCVERLGELRRAQDIPWPEVDWEAADKRIKEARDRLLKLAAKVSVLLSEVETGDEIPDYFGGMYSFLAEECFTAIVNEDPIFDTLFPAFFLASLSAHERLRRELAEQDTQTQIIFSTETLEDLLEVSGYALLMGELGKLTIWERVKGLWEPYLSRQDDEFFKVLFAFRAYRGTVHAILPRDINRQSWSMRFQQYLNSQGVAVERWPDPFGRGEELEHPSALVRVVARAVLGKDAADAFVAGYLLTWPATAGLDLPRQTEMFVERLEFERRRDSGGESA